MSIRLAERQDIAGMSALSGQSASAAQWSLRQYEDLFAVGDSDMSQRLMLVAEEAQGADSGAPHRMLALLVGHRVDEEWELENIVVAEEARRQGIGLSLLREFVAHAIASNASVIFLEVRESNHSARSLYLKAGFVEAGLRRRYYATPVEDAILYRRKTS